MRPPRVLFFGRNDWAGLAWSISRAMNRAAGGELVALSATLNAHPYGYPYECVLAPPRYDEALAVLRAFASTAEVVCTSGDGDYAALEELTWLTGLNYHTLGRRRLATLHAGSVYRAHAADYNRADAELFGLRLVGLDSVRLVDAGVPSFGFIPAVDDLDELEARVAAGPRRLVVGHAPSSRSSKGSGEILEVLEALEERGFIEVLLVEGVSWAEARAMKGRCDIYVDQLNPAVGGFGVSAVEAVKAGAIPVADCRNIPAELLPDWIATAGDGDELEALLVRLVGEPSLRKRLQDAGRAWSRGEGAFAARGRWFSARFAELLDGRLDPTVAGEAPPVAPRAPRRA